MKRMDTTKKIIVFNLLFRLVMSLIILCLKDYGKIIFYNYGTFNEYIRGIIIFMLITLAPVMVILGVIFYFYLKPLEKVIGMINNNETVSGELYDKARYVIKKFSFYLIILTVLGTLGSHIFTIIASSLLYSFFEIRELSWTLFMTASALLYSFGHITISNQILSGPRKLLNIYYKDEQRSKIGLRIKNVLLFSFIILYSFSFFLRFTSIFLARENYYSNQMEAVSEKKISLTEAADNYKNYLCSIMEGQKKEAIVSRIQFPYKTGNNRFLEYTLFFIISFTGLFLIGFIIVFLFSRELTIQIRNQRSTIKDILTGKEDLSKRISIIQYDEVGDLSDMINTLMDKLKEILKQIKESSLTVSNSSDSLSQNLIHTSAAVEEMVTSIIAITENINNQMRVVENTSKQLEIMLNGIEKISILIENQVSFVEETSAAMQEMARSIISVNNNTTKANELSSYLLKISREGNISVKNTITAITRIENTSNQVLKIVEILDNLSSRTDLLAINTAIEAAHAGIHGRGFAIIADEIRKLAENSEMQTKEIIRYIKDMYEKVQNGVKMSEQAGLAFININRDIEKTSNLIEEINMAMNEQKNGTNEILSSVDSVVNASIEVKNIAADLKMQSQAISDYMKDLFTVSTQINSATMEQDKGNKEILSLISNVKKISAQNIIVVNKLKGIITDFNLDSL
ncbi:MAG: hypothetical protein JXB88_10895 [Spirochaetales bacterium]|nr:hypothetical protein [Spirochaetales bacterium]